MMPCVYHRGAHPKDAELFAAKWTPTLRTATADLSWLLGRRYSLRSASQLVAQRYSLAVRQRDAVTRAACAPETVRLRRSRQVDRKLQGEPLWLDGFNVLIISERTHGGGPVVLGRDGAYRDVTGRHGGWRQTAETITAIHAIGRVLERLGAGEVRWLLDRPVANAGRVAALLREAAAGHRWPWTIEQVDHVDRRLADCGQVVATSDGWINERCTGWLNLLSDVVADAPAPWIVDLRSEEEH